MRDRTLRGRTLRGRTLRDRTRCGRRAVPIAAAALLTLAACGGGGSASPDPARSLGPTARSATTGVDDATGSKASPQCAAAVRTLRLYTIENLENVAKSGKAAMEKAHPGLTVELVTSATSYAGLAQQLSADSAAGQRADVAVAGLDLLPEFAGRLGAQELSPRLLRASYDQRLVGLGQIGGRQIGIPQQVSTLALVYNLDVLEKAGVDPGSLTTTAGVLAAAEKIATSGQDVQPIDIPTGQQFGQWVLNTLASSKGAPIQGDDGRPRLDTPQAREAAQFLAKAATYGPQSTDPTNQGLLRFGYRKETAMTVMTVESLAGGLKFIQDQGARGFRAGAVPFPTLPAGKQAPVARGNALTVLATDRCQREMATELVVSLLAPDVVAASTESLSYLPVDSDALTRLAPFYRQYPQLAAFNELAPSLVAPPSWAGARGPELPQAINNQVVRIMGGADIDQTLAAAQAEAESFNQ
ncbi:extracellular solute-binding protein [Parafrankia sp. EUN1f]|uniref:extracellular solute-binding protein n=1 Tax=Parafrankia sp. EUN1f TaxID=102897 RepID=UPI0001C46750|nr:extracellular solute-binding protein family 1 [Parafrankia sp. EUN1f]